MSEADGRLASAARVLVIAPNWLGDAVMALPAITDVKRHISGGRLTVAARPSVAPVFALAPDVDEVVTLRWRGSMRHRDAWRQDADQLRSTGAAVAVLLPNSFASAWLARSAGIAERWGYASDLRGVLLTRPVRRPRRSMHQSAYYQHLVGELGIAVGPAQPRLEVPPAAVEAARGLLLARGWDGRRPLLIVAPGAAYGTAKRWLPTHFARLLDQSVARHAVQPVVVGSAGDVDTAQWVLSAVNDATRASLIDLTGATSLEALAGVMRLGAACVSNDSGAMHLAGAVGVPLAAIFGPTREYETAPLMRQGSSVDVLINPVWCRPCMLRECPIDHRCMQGLQPERVAASVGRLLEGGPR